MFDPPGTRTFLPALLAHVRTAAPALPLEPAILQVLLLSIVAGDRNLILRTRDEDIALVSKLTALALSAIFGYNAHRLKCHPGSANQPPSEFLSSLFSLPPADINSGALSHRPRHRHPSNPRSPPAKLPVAPSLTASISTARSRRTSASHSSRPSIATLRRAQLDPDPADLPAPSVDPRLHPSRPQTDTSVATLATTRTHLRNASHASSETLKLPSAVVVSGLEFANLPSQKAVLRTLTERNITVSDGGILGHDQDGLTLLLPDGFLMVYVCQSDPQERPPIHKSLLDMFAMSSSVDIGARTRLAMRQLRPSPSATVSSPPTSTSAAFPTVHTPSSLPAPPTSSPVASPVIPAALLQRLKHLCATQVRIRPPLNIYLADLFSATRHYGPLDATMLTVRARQDAEALARASRILGTDPTGAELVKEHAARAYETDSISTYFSSQLNMPGASSDALMDELDPCDLSDVSSPHHSLAGQSEQVAELDVSEADIARMFPRVVSHRIRVRDSPFDEILSSAVGGATTLPGNEPHDGETIQWERETVKDILVHILAEV